jgi:BASS family bile acid:Na+ symporter
MPKIQKKLSNYSGAAFYLWSISLVVATAQITKSLIEDSTDFRTDILLAVISLILCCLQFFLGKTLGGKQNDRIAGGQSLGQKNTILAIWLAQTYLNPMSAVGAGAYILWQNIINSWQLARHTPHAAKTK